METMIDDTLVSLAIKNRSAGQLNRSDFQHIAQLFGKSTVDLLQDFVEDRSFTTLHKVLLGIECGYRSLEEYLASFGQAVLPPDVIDYPDSCGRTALAWAVEYGWVDAAKMLLQYGSNPHQLRPSIHGNSPLIHLAIAGPASQRAHADFIGVIRLLLKAGMDVNAVDHEGWTPLHVAASWNQYDTIEELALFGGSALCWDALTDDKQSAMELSLGAGVNEKVQRLLQDHERCEIQEDKESLSDAVLGDAFDTGQVEDVDCHKE